MIQDKLLALRKRSGMSQQEVADTVGVTRQTISNWELGQGSPTLDKAAELARLVLKRLGKQPADDLALALRLGHARQGRQKPLARIHADQVEIKP